MTPVDTRGALEAIDRILNRGGDADEVLRAVLLALHERGVGYGAIRFLEAGQLVDGPTIGEPAGGRRSQPVVYEHNRIGELELEVDDPAFLERVATLISPYVLLECDSGEARAS